MSRGIKAPKYAAGDTYYLSHNSGLPTRICIIMVYMKPRSTEWMYAIHSEQGGAEHIAYTSESLLSKRISKHNSPVYKNEIIMQRYEDGYRFAGNYNMDEAIKRGKEFAHHGRIKSVMLYPALDIDGNPIDDQYGVWIKWDCVISGTGINESVIRIK